MSKSLCRSRSGLTARISCGRRRISGLNKACMKTRKAPGALDPAVVPPPGGVKYAAITQDKSPCLCSERHGEYLFGRAKSGGLGQVTTKKNHGKNGYY